MRAEPGNAAEPAADREFVITRIFNAPARLLFEAYRDPAQLRQWFGPEDWPLTLCEVDFRVGGRYRFAMTGPGGVQDQPFGGTYLEIVPNRKIVYDTAFESPDAEMMIVTVTFDERGAKTTLTIHTLFGSVAMKQQHLGMGYEEGVGSGLDQLADLVVQRLQSERP